MLLNFDASSGDSNDKLTITEPDGNVITINFNDTTTGMLFNNAKSNLGVTESGKNTTYQSIVFFNETADTNSYYDSQANAITVQTSSTDTYKYNTTAGTITILVPEKYVEFGIGSYVYSNAQDLAVGGTGTFSSTKVKVNSITGTTSINYIAPSADSNAVGHLSSDAVLSTPAKPLILVGGPAANPLVATAGLTVDDFKVDGAYWSGHALVKLYDSVAALNSQTVLVIAGVDADDTVWASRMIAQEIVNNMASPLAINGTEVWLSTAVTSTSEITTATKS